MSGSSSSAIFWYGRTYPRDIHSMQMILVDERRWELGEIIACWLNSNGTVKNRDIKENSQCLWQFYRVKHEVAIHLLYLFKSKNSRWNSIEFSQCLPSKAKLLARDGRYIKGIPCSQNAMYTQVG